MISKGAMLNYLGTMTTSLFSLLKWFPISLTILRLWNRGNSKKSLKSKHITSFFEVPSIDFLSKTKRTWV